MSSGNPETLLLHLTQSLYDSPIGKGLLGVVTVWNNSINELFIELFQTVTTPKFISLSFKGEKKIS